ncbi:hypothetical protein AVEN_159669-1 [Araneus ventricosus]|uniref:Tudor domain-containing protein n=1 Tax=Araneus ventricosus TaxID=182803 RepID=A0A4Y2FJE9_ARAVE|nr:hypothetical protein AVEN_159669-1 [Araneus ventricosus]
MSTRSKKELFKKGDRVSARWAGSNVYYDAKIIDVTTRTYRVQFDDGSVSSVKYAEVKKLPQSSKESSPKTTKSVSRSRSRSGGRTTRSRSRSPARREKKAPATKNEKKSSTKEDKKKSESSSTSNSMSKEETDSPAKPILTREKLGLLKQDISSISRSSPVVMLNSYSKEMSVSMEKYESTATSSDRLRSSRLTALRSSESSRDAVDSKPALETRNAKIVDKAKYSDDEEEEEEEEEEVVVLKTGLSKSRKALYFIITALRIVLIPISLLFLVFACTKKQCTILDVPHFYSRWRDVFNAVKYPFAGIFGFHAVNCILSLIPLGRKVTGFSFEANKSPIEYCLNGFFILVLHVIVFGLCSYFGLYMNWGYDKFRGFALSAALYCIVWSIVLHIYSLFKADGTSQTKVPVLGKFYNGSYTNPVLFGKLDLKTSFIRTGLMGLVLLNLCILLKLFLMKGYVTVPLALTSGMQIFFVFDLFAREEKLLSNAFIPAYTLAMLLF